MATHNYRLYPSLRKRKRRLEALYGFWISKCQGSSHFMSSVRASIQDQSPPECWKHMETLRDRPSKLWIVPQVPQVFQNLYLHDFTWNHLLENQPLKFLKHTSSKLFGDVWSSWPQTMEMKDLRRKSKGSWTRMSGMQLALRRLDGLAFPMVLQRMILGLAENRFWKARPASQAPIVRSWK